MKKIYSCMLAMSMMALAANAADYYLSGGFNSWALEDAKAKFEVVEDGTYELKYNGTLTSGFKINDGTWENEAANFGAASDAVVLTPGETFNLSVGGTSKNIKFAGDESVSNPILVFDPTAKTLLITGSAVEAEYAYQLWGNFDGSKIWGGLELTENNGVWTATDVEVADCNFGIRKDDKSTGGQIDWIASAGAADVTVGTAMACQVDGVNFVLAAGTYDFTFDPQGMTLTVAEVGQGGDNEDPDPAPGVTVYDLYGNIFTGSWDAKAMTYADGKWVLENAEVLKGNFGIRELDEEGNQKTWLAAVGDPQVVLDEPMTVGAVDVNNFAIKNGNYTFTFDPEAMTLTVTGKEGEEIKDIISYAIHGAIFGDPLWSSEAMVESNGVWTLSATDCVAGSFGIKEVNQFGSQLNWYASAGDGEVQVGSAMECTEISGTNFTLSEGGAYIFSFNPATKMLEVKENSIDGVAGIEAAEEAVYYNLQGARVENPAAGVYVKVAAGKAEKVIVK